MCVHVCACARAYVCVINEKTPFSGFSLSCQLHRTYIFVESLDFSSVESLSIFLCAGDVASCGASDSPIKS